MVSSRRRSVCDVSGFSRRSIGRPYISILVYVRAGASLYLSMVLLLLWSDQLISMSTVHSDFTVIWHIVFSAIGWHICGNLEQPEKHKHTCVVRKPFWGCRSPFRIHKCLVALRSFFSTNDTAIPRPCQCSVPDILLGCWTNIYMEARFQILQSCWGLEIIRSSFCWGPFRISSYGISSQSARKTITCPQSLGVT
jgi:hypothetical protein